MAEACCSPLAPQTDSEDGGPATSATSLWPINEVTCALLAGLLLVAGLISAAVDLTAAAAGALGIAVVVATHEFAKALVIANGVRAGRRITPRIAAPPPTPFPESAAVAPVSLTLGPRR